MLTDLTTKALTLEHTNASKTSSKSLPFLFLFLFTSLHAIAQNSAKNEIGILFYNVENLFDTQDDTLKSDEEFLPFGPKAWNTKKYHIKLNHIARVVCESGGWNPPSIIGLCEIENKSTLNDLIYKTGLKNMGYRFIHFESEDQRGIDTGLLYHDKRFIPFESTAIKIDLGEHSRPTRDILYTFGLYNETIPLHLFVCHFPSRYGGVAESKTKRIIAAKTLCDTINTIQIHDKDANIIVMGDFNDNPKDSSMLILSKDAKLMNLSIDPDVSNKCKGTLKHKFEWNNFDQFLVSQGLFKNLLNSNYQKSTKILDFDFLLEPDHSYTGHKPFRTYVGYKYNNGYSDHLPIWLNLTPRQQ